MIVLFLLLLFLDGILPFYFSFIPSIFLFTGLLLLEERFQKKRTFYFLVFLFVGWFDLLYRPFPFYSLGTFLLAFFSYHFFISKKTLFILPSLFLSISTLIFTILFYFLKEKAFFNISFFVYNFFFPFLFSCILSLVLYRLFLFRRNRSIYDLSHIE